MEITVKDRRVKAALENYDICKRQYGTDMAEKLRNRYGTLHAAESLADFWPPRSGPERCHELKADRAGVFSVDLKHPFRLLFAPVEAHPTKDRSNEKARWSSIKAIEILGIEDTHG